MAMIKPLCQADAAKSGICWQVTLAQFILASGYGQTELAQKANNFFGMKASLSGNTWKSEWNGKTYRENTEEQDRWGNVSIITADFRAYNNIAESIADHSAYLSGAKNGTALRYKGLIGCVDPRTAISIIKNGGYATDTKYVDKVMSIITRWA